MSRSLHASTYDRQNPRIFARQQARCEPDAQDLVQGQLQPAILSLSFVFLLVGYGTKVGLVPLHN